MIKKYNIVEIEWFDAQSYSGYAEDIGKLKEWGLCLSKSVGYLLFEDKEKVILGFSIFQGEPEVNSVKHLQMIPRKMIKKINKLREIKDDKKES